MRALLLIVTLVGCSTAPPAPAETAPDAPEQVQDKTSVMVPRDGKRFDPPVAAARIPQGAHYCDMGTVHYARMTEGDGTCPVCGMDLKTKAEERSDAGEQP